MALERKVKTGGNRLKKIVERKIAGIPVKGNEIINPPGCVYVRFVLERGIDPSTFQKIKRNNPSIDVTLAESKGSNVILVPVSFYLSDKDRKNLVEEAFQEIEKALTGNR